VSIKVSVFFFIVDSHNQREPEADVSHLTSVPDLPNVIFFIKAMNMLQALHESTCRYSSPPHNRVRPVLSFSTARMFACSFDIDQVMYQLTAKINNGSCKTVTFISIRETGGI
jgi:hypothetical protein